MRYREDSETAAWCAARKLAGKDEYKDCNCGEPGCTFCAIKTTPPAEPGDVWRIHWWRPEGEEKPLAGYAICCPCGDVHFWTTANNCASFNKETALCAHTNVRSCWDWTGSAEDNKLSCTPSLLARQPMCPLGWHGYLTNGELIPC